ncbi:unnamed protein product [Durusdinium trenchii]|uniref:Pentatricopeptide repeat-containing protein, chloroplastic n=1 Tax=Durusdinium trenchii TaxID=1381693 RepID=A0ABP0J1P3_9DINO
MELEVSLEELLQHLRRAPVTTGGTSSSCAKRCFRRLELSETDDPRSWSLFMGALGRQGLWELALESLRALRQKHDAEGDAPSSRTRSEQRLVASAMTACSRATQWSIALLLLGSTGKPDVKLLNAGIAACAKGGKWRRSLELLSEIQAQLMLPTVVSFGSIISACASGQAWPVAIQSLDLMTSLQIDPSVVTYSAAASACEKGHQWPMAFAVLQLLFCARGWWIGGVDQPARLV